MVMSDKHFAELVKNLKQDHGFANFKVVADWYAEHYFCRREIDNVENAKIYITAILEVCTFYVHENSLVNIVELVRVFNEPSYIPRPSFNDLNDEEQSGIQFKLLAVICNKLINTRKDAIPYYNEL
jgi:hypothetical protein